MPNFLDAPEILPLPSLQTYSSISFLLLSCAVYYAFQVSSEPNWKLHEFLFSENNSTSSSATVEHDHENDIDSTTTVISNITNNSATNTTTGTTSSFFNDTIRNSFFESLFKQQNETLELEELFKNPMFVNLLNVTYIMVHEPLCVWTLINMSYCLLILFGKFIQKIVFGDLRSSEQQLLRDKFWNFLLYKFIFVFSVINVQYMDELISWCAWFSVLGFMFLLTHLCKERFSFLAYSPSVSKWDHFKLLTLLISIQICTIPLFIIGVIVGLHTSFSIGAFLVSEVVLLFLRTLHCFILYLVHLWDLSRDSIWEKRTAIIYYIELIFDLLILSIDFCHHLHMLFWANIILSVSSLVILIQLKAIFTDIIRRIKKHTNYLQVLNLMEENFPMATREELTDDNNDCAICWDKMENARKLPCNHMFHTTCLRSWLEQDTSCPTCRHSLRHRQEDDDNVAAIPVDNVAGANGIDIGPAGLRPGVQTRFFHFDGSRYARWLPTVSVEVTRPNMIDININASVTRNNETSPEFIAQQHIEYMGQQVLEWFPQFSLTSILEDLRNTRSVEHTIENILDGRLRQSTSTTSTSTSSVSSSTTSRNNHSPGGSNNNLENNFIFTPEINNDNRNLEMYENQYSINDDFSQSYLRNTNEFVPDDNVNYGGNTEQSSSSTTSDDHYNHHHRQE